MFLLASFDFTSLLFPIILLAALVLMFVLTSRSQKKRDRELNEMLNNLHVGDEVTTIGGIIGAIVSIKDETVTIETSKDRTKIRFLRSAIKSVDVKAEDAQ